MSEPTKAFHRGLHGSRACGTDKTLNSEVDQQSCRRRMNFNPCLSAQSVVNEFLHV